MSEAPRFLTPPEAPFAPTKNIPYFNRIYILLFAIITAVLVTLTASVFFFVFYKPGICRTDDCASFGDSMYASINFAVSPCHNFYQFACQNWERKHPRQNKSYLAKVALDELLQELLLEKDTPTTAKSVQLTRELYQECTDQKTRDALGLSPLKQLLSDAFSDSAVTSWPVLSPLPDDDRGVPFMMTLARFSALGANAIIHFDLEMDSNRASNSSKIFHFRPPTFALPRDFMDSEIIKDYFDYIRAIMELFIEPREVDMTMIDAMVELEINLAQAVSKSPEAEFGTLQEVEEDKEQFLINVLRSYSSYFDPSIDITSSEQVFVMDIEYYSKMQRIVNDTPLQVLYNYLGFRLISALGHKVNSQIEKLTFKFNRAENQNQMPRWEQCLDMIQTDLDLDWALARLYIDNRLVPGTKEYIEKMVRDVRAAFKSHVQNEATWLDEVTRLRVLEKVNAMQSYIAYPDWLLDTEQLDSYYGFYGGHEVATKKGKFLESFLEYKRFVGAKELRERHQPSNFKVNWPGKFNLRTVNAFAFKEANSIVIPLSYIRQELNFNNHLPGYLNYARLGWTIGHEITHLFDVIGKEYDDSGSWVNWWSAKARAHYEKAAQCFIDQYGAIFDQVSGVPLNGSQTVNENISDNGAIRLAFAAFKELAKKTKLPRIPKMESFTPEKIFFIASAQTFCSSQTGQDLANSINNFEHSPSMYRVNVAFANFDEFAKTFECPLGWPMNPEQKCTLW